MRLSFTIIVLSFCSVKSIAASTPGKSLFLAITSYQNTSIGFDRITSLKIKEIQKLIGRKLTLKEKISFAILKQQVKKRGYDVGEKEIKDKGKTSFIIGLIGLIGLIIPGLGLLSLPLAIIAIIVGNKAKGIDPANKKARTGVLFGWITIALLLIVATIVVLVLALPIA